MTKQNSKPSFEPPQWEAETYFPETELLGVQSGE